MFETLYKESGLVDDKRDIYEEYLSVPHHCPSTTPVTHSSHPGIEWKLYSVKELLTELQKKVEEEARVVFKNGDCLPSYREKLRTTQSTQSSWHYGIVGHNEFNPPIVRMKQFTVHICA